MPSEVSGSRVGVRCGAELVRRERDGETSEMRKRYEQRRNETRKEGRRRLDGVTRHWKKHRAERWNLTVGIRLAAEVWLLCPAKRRKLCGEPTTLSDPTSIAMNAN